MKHFLIALVCCSAMPAAAEQIKANVEDIYSTVIESTPVTQQVCENVEVPIYGTVQGPASTGDTIAGALIGGAIGNQFGGGSGKDAATVLGAIIGADVANKQGRTRQVITGYRKERQCQNVTEYKDVRKKVYDYSILTFKYNGQNYETTFMK